MQFSFVFLLFNFDCVESRCPEEPRRAIGLGVWEGMGVFQNWGGQGWERIAGFKHRPVGGEDPFWQSDREGKRA